MSGLVLAVFAGLVVFTALGRSALAPRTPLHGAAPSTAASGRARPVIAVLRARTASLLAPSYRLELDVVNTDGSRLRPLASGPWSREDALAGAVPSWSPDGRKLVFVRRLERGSAACTRMSRCSDEIYAINADGSGLRRLTRNSTADGHPVWSPDGGRIAFLSWRDGPWPSIYVMNADGGSQRRLTPMTRGPRELAWSPDGEKLAFTAAAGPLGTADIFVMNADGSDLRDVTHTATTSFDLAWSPDARQIAYIEDHVPERGSSLYVVNADGAGKHRVTRRLALDAGAPSWSPDRRKLAFAGVGGIYTVHSDGSRLRKLTGSPRGAVEPKWSPDGQQIAFLSSRDDPGRAFDLFIMNADGSGQRNLTQTPNVSEVGAAWAPGNPG